jgi:hypothetical protein
MVVNLNIPVIYYGIAVFYGSILTLENVGTEENYPGIL